MKTNIVLLVFFVLPCFAQLEEQEPRKPDLSFRKYFTSYRADESITVPWWIYYEKPGPETYPDTRPKFERSDLYWHLAPYPAFWQTGVGGGFPCEYCDGAMFFSATRGDIDDLWESHRLFLTNIDTSSLGLYEDGGGVYIPESHTTQDPRYSTHWLASITIPFYSLHDAVEHAALTKYKPEVTSAIVNHIISLGIIEEAKMDSLRPYQVVAAMVTYTDIALYHLVQNVRRAMGNEPITVVSNVDSIFPGDTLTYFWRDNYGPWLVPKYTRIVTGVENGKVIAKYPFGSIHGVWRTTTINSCYYSESDRSEIVFRELPEREVEFLAVHRKQ